MWMKLGQQNTPTASLKRGKTPTSVLIITLKILMVMVLEIVGI